MIFYKQSGRTEKRETNQFELRLIIFGKEFKIFKMKKIALTKKNFFVKAIWNNPVSKIPINFNEKKKFIRQMQNFLQKEMINLML